MPQIAIIRRHGRKTNVNINPDDYPTFQVDLQGEEPSKSNNWGYLAHTTIPDDIFWNYQILLQRRSQHVKEPYTYTFPGGSFDEEEVHALQWFEAAKDQANKERVIRRAALREVIEEAGNGRSNGQRYLTILPEIMAGGISVPQLTFPNIALPNGLVKEFEHNPSVSRRIGGETYLYLLNSTLHDDPYINHWEPDALPQFHSEIDRHYTAHSLKHGYIWVNVDYFLSNPNHPVPGSSCPMSSWLHKWCNGREKAGILMQAIRELELFFASFEVIAPPAALPPPPAPPAANNVFLGMSVDGYSGNRYPNLVKEWIAQGVGVTQPSYPGLRIYVGDGRAALYASRTGRLLVRDAGGGPPIHVVMNCAAAEEPYKYMNTQSGIVYANIVSIDNPTPAYADDLQRPDWSAVIQAARTAYDMMEMRKRVHSQTTTCGEPVNVLIHCRMGKIRMIQPDLTFPTLNTLNISISDLKITHILYFLLYRSKSVGRHCRLGHGLSLPHDPQPCGSPCSSSSITIVRHRSSN